REGPEPHLLGLDREGANTAIRQTGHSSLGNWYYMPGAVGLAYRGMARSIAEQNLHAEPIPHKAYLYVLRALLAVRWVEQDRGPVPVEFNRLAEAADSTPISGRPSTLSSTESGPGRSRTPDRAVPRFMPSSRPNWGARTTCSFPNRRTVPASSRSMPSSAAYSTAPHLFPERFPVLVTASSTPIRPGSGSFAGDAGVIVSF
ncbi:MAG: hypothetical protein BRD42_00855, partial [Bacteroidetes bacterium QS_3_64_15]